MTKINKPNLAVAVEMGKTLSGEMAFAFSHSDGKTLFIAENTVATPKVLLVKMGEGMQSTADLSLSIPASSKICFTLESGAYKMLYGANKGKVVMDGTSIKITQILLP